MASRVVRRPLLGKQKDNLSAYRDRRFSGSQEEFDEALRTSTTIYVGNLSFFTTEEQIYEVLSHVGEIKKIIMGLDKNNKTPCGFCFVMFYSREDTEDAVKYISGTIVDDRPIRVDFDWGFQEGRQWGRGRSGGQVRDEYRTDYDPGRGGYGKIVQKELEGRQLVDYGGPVGMGALQSYGGGFPHNSFGGGQGNYGGYQHGRGGRKRERNDDHMLADGVKRVAHQNRLERNPRFRDKGDDSDEDESGKA